jgi:uncharacterized protein (TIGR02265 family)
VLDAPIILGTVLTGPFSLEAGLATIPPETTVKGMFFRRLADMLGPDYEAVSDTLSAPVKDGKYVAFRDYPQRDYARILVATARKRFPSLPSREAVRHVAREDFKIFAESMVGRVIMTVVGDARNALIRVPDAYRAIVPAAKVRAADVDPLTVRVSFEPLMGFLEYTLGQLEGVVLAFEGSPLTTIRLMKNGGHSFDVVHRG